MRITLNQIHESGACSSGVDWFRETFGDAYEIAEYTPVQQAGILMDPTGRKFFGWAVAAGLIPIWSMNMWDLRGANLSGTDLSGASLYGASLSGADLYGANLYGASLYGASLSGANLRGTDLSGADLSRADLSGASLYGARNIEDAIGLEEVMA